MLSYPKRDVDSLILSEEAVARLLTFLEFVMRPESLPAMQWRASGGFSPRRRYAAASSERPVALRTAPASQRSCRQRTPVRQRQTPILLRARLRPGMRPYRGIVGSRHPPALVGSASPVRATPISSC